MESHNQLLKLMKVSRFFPSSFTSCHFRTLPDVAESSITIAKPNKILHENDLSSNEPLCKSQQLLASASARASKLKPKKLMEKNVNDQDRCTSKKYSSSMLFNQSSSSNSAWFTDEDGGGGGGDGDTFFSLSSNSGDSFRLKTSRRFRRCEEMKSIDETGRRSFSSVGSFDTVPSKCSSRRRKPAVSAVKTAGEKKCGDIRREKEMGSDHFSTQVYYSRNKTGSGRIRRRRRTAKNGRKTRKHSSRRVFYGGACGIEEGYAEEKISGDPRGDFRASMVEMIVEKRIFGAEDLQRLLKCFLSLNDAAYHGMIFDVFNEICETLFIN